MKYLKNFNESISFNDVSVDLVDFKGNEFRIGSSKTRFTQDEVEIILEDIKVVSELKKVKYQHKYIENEHEKNIKI